MEYRVRPMSPDDIRQVQVVARASWHTAYQGIIPTEIQDRFLNSAYSDEMMKRRLEQSFLYVAEDRGRIVGFANFSPVNEDKVVELMAIYLEPEYQGRGIGSALLQEGIVHSAGAKEVYAHVERENKAGRRFYESRRFVTAAEFDDEFDGHRLKTLRMVLTL
ncbi:GNAT family N-acetyltransferase [Paenibacillus sp. YPG26]|uniref:GNAT family N-acetyltransferase n=1 Tax=Paenibacillus sp. YPG26 TaxID=2878915 RepID=UPI00203B2B25|nr:GNAT family N-acetyltransferase [Paenibacillus sp. YPG26]USB33815.1 GNAT family N-acetyltransferase [Paenibacillus sp. YPG26]